MSNETTYIVAGKQTWNRRVYNEIIRYYPGTWYYIEQKESLVREWVNQIKPRYIFFLHWSWLVPEILLKTYECVCFHMTDVPYGRGGSPLQNLIIRGHRNTKLTALRMVNEFDAGPVYFKEDLSLEGNAEEIYIRATYLSACMIERIIRDQPQPIEQIGEPTMFNRRKPVESEIPKLESLQSLYDFIRMLDVDGYPHAFIEYQGFRYEFKRAAMYDGRIVADVTIRPVEKPGEAENP
jgi:methionyl-tRNA formyltransferase